MQSTTVQPENLPPSLRLLTYGDVASVVGCEAATVSKWARAGKLKVIRLAPNKPRVSEEELIRFLHSRTV